MEARDMDIMALVERVQQTKLAVVAAEGMAKAAREASKTADVFVEKARIDYDEAQNDLVVAAGGQDRHWMWSGLSSRDTIQKGG